MCVCVFVRVFVLACVCVRTCVCACVRVCVLMREGVCKPVSGWKCMIACLCKWVRVCVGIACRCELGGGKGRTLTGHYTTDNKFPFSITLFEKEYFLMSVLQCFFINLKPWPPLLLCVVICRISLLFRRPILPFYGMYKVITYGFLSWIITLSIR